MLDFLIRLLRIRPAKLKPADQTVERMPAGKMAIGTELTDWNGVCPDCGNTEFYEGPSGGLCINVKCANEACGTRLNVAHLPGLMLAQRI